MTKLSILGLFFGVLALGLFLGACAERAAAGPTPPAHPIQTVHTNRGHVCYYIDIPGLNATNPARVAMSCVKDIGSP